MVAVDANSSQRFRKRRGWRIIRIRNGTLEKYLLLILLFGLYIFYANVTFLNTIDGSTADASSNINNAEAVVDASNLGKTKGETASPRQQQPSSSKKESSMEYFNEEEFETKFGKGLKLGPDPFIPSATADVCVDKKSNNNKTDDFRKRSGLFVIIAGIEHTGTTMISSLLMNAPNLYSAFECGFLLADSPQEFQPPKVHPMFVEGLTAPNAHHWWGLPPEKAALITNHSTCFEQQYSLLRKHSPLFNASEINNSSWIVDKTPQYYRVLYEVMQKSPGVPVILTQRYDQDILDSYAKRGIWKKYARKALKEFHQNKEACETSFPDRLFVLDFNKFGERPHTVMAELFAFLGLKWKKSYLDMKNFNAKGEPFGRPPSPAFNISRINCKECASDPYGNRVKRNIHKDGWFTVMYNWMRWRWKLFWHGPSKKQLQLMEEEASKTPEYINVTNIDKVKSLAGNEDNNPNLLSLFVKHRHVHIQTTTYEFGTRFEYIPPPHIYLPYGSQIIEALAKNNSTKNNNTTKAAEEFNNYTEFSIRNDCKAAYRMTIHVPKHRVPQVTPEYEEFELSTWGTLHLILLNGSWLDVDHTHFYQRWNDLAPTLKILVQDKLGYTPQAWNDGLPSPQLGSDTPWNQLTEEQKGWLSKLDCTKQWYQKIRCAVRRKIDDVGKDGDIAADNVGHNIEDTEPKANEEFRVGDRVEGNYKNKGKYYPGVIIWVSKDGSKISIRYDDDGSQETLSTEKRGTIRRMANTTRV